MTEKRDRRAYMQEYQKRKKEQINAYHKRYHAEHKHEPAYSAMKCEAAKVSRRKRKYGITREQYEGMLQAQDGCCMICHVRLNNELRVDHNHQTGEIRALLCSNCNTGLGMFKEDPARLVTAIEYLRKYST